MNKDNGGKYGEFFYERGEIPVFRHIGLHFALKIQTLVIHLVLALHLKKYDIADRQGQVFLFCFFRP